VRHSRRGCIDGRACRCRSSARRQGASSSYGIGANSTGRFAQANTAGSVRAVWFPGAPGRHLSLRRLRSICVQWEKYEGARAPAWGITVVAK
jgi:hypothetical protein